MSNQLPASVRQLHAAIDRAFPAGEGGVQPVRRRQLRMVADMWGRALEKDDGFSASARSDARRLFTRPALESFWRLVLAGDLRARPAEEGKPRTLASLRIVRDCLGLLADEIIPGRPVWLPRVPQQEPKATVAPRAVRSLYRAVVDLAAGGPLERSGTGLRYEDRVRLLAMVSVVLDVAPRAGELSAQTLADLVEVEGGAYIGVRRRQQRAAPNRAEEIAALAEVHPATVEALLWGATHQMSEATRQRVLAAIRELEPAPEVEWYVLHERTQVALRQWLSVRETLVAPLQGARDALWVTLKATHLGPAGLPLGSTGVSQAYARGVTALNVLMAGSYGWEPLPRRLEQLRRSLAVVPVELPAGES
ncbi:hypothetical protein ABZ404_38615 [Streptomyces sp. NPDC005878]|uniref:hypothetical protein n=1 Tax=Streptomyces sp. NPDC005878 TaxID=3157077 RepID=UPI0033FCB74D